MSKNLYGRLLDGEPMVYRGYLWFVKGFQHPSHGVIAFPRYNLVNRARVSHVYRVVDHLYYWDCLRLETPIIDPDEAILYKPRLSNEVLYVVDLVKDLLGLSEGEYVITGSTLLGYSRDLDILVYGFSNEYLSMLERALDNGLLKRVDHYLLYREYLNKHRGDTDLYTYLYIKRDTYLHMLYRGLHINLRFTRYSHGYMECVEPVFKREFFIGEIEVVEPIYKYVIPAKYTVKYGDHEWHLESFREIYAELPRGRYYVEGFLEYRRDGIYIVPDHGCLVKID